jgi:hypothetical protein
MKCGSDGNFTNLFLVDGKYQNLSLFPGEGRERPEARKRGPPAAV